LLFCEPIFLFFFLPLTLAAYYAAPRRARNVVLSLASLLFYAAGEWRFLGWLVASIAVNYWIGRGIAGTRGTAWAKRLLIIGIASDLSLLVVFKYAGFIVSSLDGPLTLLGLKPVPVPKLLLPLGISFFTFHKISYKVDVYRGTAEARKAPLDLALYILMFPQLIAGPIVRYYEIAGELMNRVQTRADMAAGIQRFVVGFGKKMIIANTAAYCADRVFALPASDLTTGLAWLGLLCYALQIYFDFSGYSDMAIGLARMFGFHFPENFNHPYISTSITEFWRRWHMSLSRWFRDYVYIPLGGNRRGAARTYANLVTVFFLCGLWHGASWTFVIWGMFHGSLLVVERVGLHARLARLPRVLRHAYALLMILVGWVLFRADTLPHAIMFLKAMAGFAPRTSPEDAALYLNPELVACIIVGAFASTPIGSVLLSAWDRLRARAREPIRPALENVTVAASLAAGSGVFLYSAMLMAAGTYNPFIYFRF
jgi:alginate O-acetyltransferase complex protein AlgI